MDDEQSLWAFVRFDKRAVESMEHFMLIAAFRKEVPIVDSNEIQVIMHLPLNDERTFVFSPAAALLGARVLAGLSIKRCTRPEPQTQRLFKVI